MLWGSVEQGGFVEASWCLLGREEVVELRKNYAIGLRWKVLCKVDWEPWVAYLYHKYQVELFKKKVQII